LDAVVDEAIALYRSGLSGSEVGNHFGVTQTTVHRLLAKCGIDRRPPAEASRLLWKPEVREKKRQGTLGRPSGAVGKRWTYDRIVKRPNLAGEHSRFRKGGRTSLQQRLRTSVEYRFWREAVFRRDNHTCTACGARTAVGVKIDLNADHVIALSVLLDRHAICSLDQALVCPELWALSNGRTLCHECHRRTDTYGRNLSLNA
jgi:5-methylcytosine-specific restriction endonuclease McrA